LPPAAGSERDQQNAFLAFLPLFFSQIGFGRATTTRAPRGARFNVFCVRVQRNHEQRQPHQQDRYEPVDRREPVQHGR